ncbi:MAG: hypothetical protein QW117_00120 [Candidatus Pacearchaeota archaeon]
MSKALGYILMLIGVIILFSGLILKNSQMNIPLINNINIKFIPVVGIILVIIGFILTNYSSSKNKKHLPIYDKTGKKIVGYRESK